MGRAKTGIMRTTKGEKGLEKLVHLAKGLRKGGRGGDKKMVSVEGTIPRSN